MELSRPTKVLELSTNTLDLSLPKSKYKRTPPKLPCWRAHWYERLAVQVLGRLSVQWQHRISKWYTSIFNQAFSKAFIAPFVWYHFNDPHYLDQFKPPNGKEVFDCFQDFFTRQFKSLPLPKGKKIWSCEGNLCHAGYVKDIPLSNVKGQIRKVHDIFGVSPQTIPADYYFTNIFLHNKNYHRIHAPVKGIIKRIQHIPGDLVILRPWIYKMNPSLPAFRNERYNIDIEDDQGRIWYLSIVGGPAVKTIRLSPNIKPGSQVNLIQELALFQLGSTCCMAAPEAMSDDWKVNNWIELGDRY